jgi:DNA-damage-inducible protein D
MIYKVMDTKIVIFRGKEVRRTLYNNEWWFSIHDVVGVLTDSKKPREYFDKVLQRDEAFKSTYGQIVRRLPLLAEDGKMRDQICANTEGIFRIIQSIPSPKAEPFKRWLAKVGYERIQEIEDPELATKRTRALYKAKGYSDAWIEKRMRGIAIREELTNEWQNRGVKEELEYGILTAEISKATFGMTPKEYKEFKGLKRQNLRDHMNDLELIFSMLGEASTTEITRNQDVYGFVQSKIAARKGGKIAGDARKKLEIESGKKVSNKENYLQKPQNKKLLK